MRFSLIFLVACATPRHGEVCHPVASWGQPAIRCTQPAAPPPVVEAPPPVVEAPPPPPPAKVEVKDDTIDLKEKVEFATGKAELVGNSTSLLDEVVKVMTDHPEITKIRIEGHTDNTSTKSFNQRLSDERAAAVRAYLISKGIKADRMVSKGFGQDKPIADNTTDEGRAANRRVEIHILERKK
jgi:outer membrane protein OmpA-like peptidoglycan-associated protein